MEKKSKCYAGALCDGDMCCSSDSTPSIQSEEKKCPHIWGIEGDHYIIQNNLGDKCGGIAIKEFKNWTCPFCPSKEKCKHENIKMMFYEGDKAGTKCIDCGIESLPPQPNSEERCNMENCKGCNKESEIHNCHGNPDWHRENCHSPKPEEKNRCDKCYNPNCNKTCDFYRYPNDSKLWQKTVEVTPKPKEKCEFCSKVGLKCIPEICTPTHTSDEWEKEFEEFCSEFNESKVFDIKYTLKSFISSLLSQSEQRVRKEMVEVLGKHNARILNYFQQQGTPDMPMIAYDERVCLIPAIKKATHETCDIINLISK